MRKVYLLMVVLDERRLKMELYKNFDGKAPMIDVNDAAMLLIDHQSGNKKTETKRQLSDYTRNHIKNTLLLMLKTKAFRDIRITVLCREAHIARGTFYLNPPEDSFLLGGG